VLTVIGSLIYTFNRTSNLQPLLLGLFAMIEGASYKLFSCLNRAGLTVSRRTVERIRDYLSEDALACAIEAATGDANAWFLIFDNINLHLKKHHRQRVDNLNSMINATNCALIKLPATIKSTVFDKALWLARQVKRTTFKAFRLRITASEDKFMLECFEASIAQILVDYSPNHELWDGIKALRQSIHARMPKDRPLKPQKTETFPLGVVDVDEGSKSGCVEVLDALRERMRFTKDSFASRMRVVAGDQLTVRNLRLARAERQEDISDFERLTYVHPVAQLFHFDMNAEWMVMAAHSINCINDAGSLSRQKDLLKRKFDINKPPYADAKSLISHSLIARILTCAM
jgi:hypothetical protein